MKRYAHFGFDFVLCLGYRGNMIKEYFLNYEAMNRDCTVRLGPNPQINYHGHHEESGFCVTLADTGQDAMTGDRMKQIAKYIDEDDFLLTYGDGLSDVNISNLVAFHRAHGRFATVTAVRPLSRFGMLELSDQQEVTRFSEKPLLDGWMSAGHFVLTRKVFDYIGGPGCTFEREPLERLSADGQLAAYCHEGFFFAMDTYREFKHLNELWTTGNAPWKTW